MNLYSKIASFSFLGALVACVSACDLDEYNFSGETADQVFSEPAGMEDLVNQLYYNFRWKYYGREDPCLYMEGAADIWQNVANSYEYGMQLTRCVDLQGDRGQIASCWNRVYDNINTANAIINRVADVHYSDAQKGARNSHEGEARWMRSYCYWWLVEFFGDIEMRTQETNSAEFAAVRTPRTVIYDQVIIPDAERACEVLPVAPLNGNVGRATQKAAYALLARVCLARAQYELPGSAEQKAFYQKALNAAKFVIDNKEALGIKIYDSYDEIWQAKNNKNNSEFLFVTTFSSNSALDADSKPNRLYRYFSPRLVQNAGIVNSATSWEYPSEGGLLMPTFYFMNLWQDWDARYDAIFQEKFVENSSRGSYKWTEVMRKRFSAPESIVGKSVASGNDCLWFTRQHVSAEDKEALAQVGCGVVDIDMLYETEKINAWGGAKVRNYQDDEEISEYRATSFPRFMKYRIWDRDEAGTFLLAAANGQFGFADVPVMRYAEMPLVAAECLINLGQAAEAAEVVNAEIRNARVVKAGHDISEAQVAAGDMTIEWIMEERARELCGEWLRWFDVKRIYAPLGNFASTIVGRNPSMIGDDCMQEYHALRPIPNTFLDKLTNAEEFGQNPGYNAYVRSSD